MPAHSPANSLNSISYGGGRYDTAPFAISFAPPKWREFHQSALRSLGRGLVHRVHVMSRSARAVRGCVALAANVAAMRAGMSRCRGGHGCIRCGLGRLRENGQRREGDEGAEAHCDIFI